MKKLNIENIIKILILLGFSIFYFKIIVNNKILMYVHPRIIPFVVLGMIAMLIIALFLIKDSVHKKKKKIKFKNYVIFIIPLIMIFFMESNSVGSATIKSSDINTNSNISSNGNLNNVSKDNRNQDNNLQSGLKFDLYEGKTESDGEGTINKKQLDVKDSVINVNSKNFVFSLDEILSNPDKYVGQEIEITGFVYKDENFKKNEFVVGRFMMTCCAADMQIVGIRCEHNNLEAYNRDMWIKVKGKIKKDTYKGDVDTVIVVEHIEKDLNPDTSYVYPY